MRNILEAMSVGEEKPKEAPEKNNLENVEIIKEKFRNWRMGVGVSCLPLVLFLVLEFLHDKKFCVIFYDLFCDIGIMFIGISFSVTAFNDFVGFTRTYKKTTFNCHIFLIILGVVIYTTVMVEKYENIHMNMDKVFVFNLVYFVVMLSLTANKYIREIRG